MPKDRSLPKYPLTPDDPLWPSCACGCGQSAPARKQGKIIDGVAHLPGEPQTYVKGHAGHGGKGGLIWRGDSKRCASCGEYKRPGDFTADESKRSGVASSCKACRYASRREWYIDNRDARLVADRVYREINRDAVVARIKRWQAANPEAVREYARRTTSTYRARKKDAFVEDIDPLTVLERDDGICGICGGDVDPFDFAVDHIQPLNGRGLHAYWNVQTAHPSCNAAKGDRF